MSAAAVLAESRRCGVRLHRVGDRLRWRAPSPIAPDLLALLREHKTALLALLSMHKAIYATITAGYGTREDLQACCWFAAHDHRNLVQEIAALERRCDKLAAAGATEVRYREAVSALVKRFAEIRELYEASLREAR